MNSILESLAAEYDKAFLAMKVARTNLEKGIVDAIKSGKFKSNSKNSTIWTTLQNLRKRGVIVNHGSRKFPEWTVRK
jgi:hypothetical protein